MTPKERIEEQINFEIRHRLAHFMEQLKKEGLVGDFMVVYNPLMRSFEVRL